MKKSEIVDTKATITGDPTLQNPRVGDAAKNNGILDGGSYLASTPPTHPNQDVMWMRSGKKRALAELDQAKKAYRSRKKEEES